MSDSYHQEQRQLQRAQRKHDSQEDHRFDWQDETFVCQQCGERRLETDRAQGQGLNICFLCDDTNGHEALVKLMNDPQPPLTNDDPNTAY